MATDQIAEIAAGLSEAQRRAILATKMMNSVSTTRGLPPVLHALKRKGITEGLSGSRLTPLGQQVAAYLKEQNSHA